MSNFGSASIWSDKKLKFAILKDMEFRRIFSLIGVPEQQLFTGLIWNFFVCLPGTENILVCCTNPLLFELLLLKLLVPSGNKFLNGCKPLR